MSKRDSKGPIPPSQQLPVTLPKQKGLRKIEDCDIMQRVSTRQPKMDIDRKIRAVEAYAELGTVANAARAAGVCPQTITNHMKLDPEFLEGMQIAQGEFRDKLEREAYRRAVEGWEEPVFSQRLGTQIGTVRRYSDGLLQFIMKKWMPEYREKVQADVNITGGVLVLAEARASSEEEFEARFKDATYTPTSEIIDVVAEEIRPEEKP